MAVARKTIIKPATRAWQRMLSGRRLDLLDPSPLDIEIEDIAQGLPASHGGTGKLTVRNFLSRTAYAAGGDRPACTQAAH